MKNGFFLSGMFVCILITFIAFNTECIVAQVQNESAPLWAVGTPHGVVLQWTIPDYLDLPQVYSVQRSPIGKKRYTTIGTVSRVGVQEWSPLLLPESRSKLLSLVTSAESQYHTAERRTAILKLRDLAYLNPEPYLFILGLTFSDTTARPWNQYDYAIFVGGVKICEAKNVTASRAIQPKPPETIVAKPSSNAVHFVWSIKDGFQSGVRGYNVYRHDGIRNAYKRINQSPIITINRDEDAYSYSLFEDLGLANSSIYLYYITSLDVFGNESQPSSIISATPDNYPPQTPPIITETRISGDSIVVKWTHNTARRTKGYNVYRSFLGSSSKYRINEKPLSAFARSFSDIPRNLQVDFVSYSITAIDNQGVESKTSFEYSSAVPDIQMPEPPGYVQSQTAYKQVSLFWTKSVSEDVLGYEITRAKSAYSLDILPKIGFIKDSTYVDYLPDEDGNAPHWYRIRAVDRRGNISSWTPAIIAVGMNGTLPHPPTIVVSRGSFRKAEIEWSPSLSNSIKGYHINRYDDTTSTPITITKEELSPSTLSFEDHTIRPGRAYWYEVVAVDTSYTFSPPSNRVAVYCGDKFSLRAPYIHTLTTTEAGVKIEWRWAVQEIPFGNVIVERSNDGKKFVQISPAIPASNGMYIDESSMSYERYYYRLRFKAPSGIVSDPSTSELMIAR